MKNKEEMVNSNLMGKIHPTAKACGHSFAGRGNMKLRSIVNDVVCQYEEEYKKRNKKNDNEKTYTNWLDKTTKRTAKLLMKLIKEE